MRSLLFFIVFTFYQVQSCFAQIITQIPIRWFDPPPITVNYGILMPAAREFLESRWTDSTAQLERGYCVGQLSYNVQWAFDRWGRRLGKEIMARVWTIYEADTLLGAGLSGIETLACDDNMPTVHTHPPTTCINYDDPATCTFGGVGAFQCQPSRADLMTLVKTGRRFDIVQCDKQAFRFYWPAEYRVDSLRVLP